MNTGEVVRRLALATEWTCCAWRRRYCYFPNGLPLHLPSEHKLERNNVAASIQNQDSNAILFCYVEDNVRYSPAQCTGARRAVISGIHLLPLLEFPVVLLIEKGIRL